MHLTRCLSILAWTTLIHLFLNVFKILYSQNSFNLLLMIWFHNIFVKNENKIKNLNNTYLGFHKKSVVVTAGQLSLENHSLPRQEVCLVNERKARQSDHKQSDPSPFSLLGKSCPPKCRTKLNNLEADKTPKPKNL